MDTKATKESTYRLYLDSKRLDEVPVGVLLDVEGGSLQGMITFLSYFLQNPVTADYYELNEARELVRAMPIGKVKKAVFELTEIIDDTVSPKA